MKIALILTILLRGGKQKNRRTDIVFYQVEKSNKPTLPDEKIDRNSNLERKKVDTILTVKDSCDRDTVLFFPQGLEVKMNICDYHKKKDYFGIDATISIDSLKNSDLSTYDSKGNPLITGGMMCFRNSQIDTCFDKPVVFRIKLDSCSRNIDFQLWNIERNGRWIEDKQTNLRKIKIGKDVFLEFQLKCIKNGLCKNFDRKSCAKKIKFKIGNGLKITELRFVSECPNFATSERNIHSKSVSFWIPCGCKNDDKQFIKVKAINKKKELFEMDFQSISTLSKAFRISVISNCKGLIRITKVCSTELSKKKYLFGKTTMKKYLLPIELFKKVVSK